MICHKCLHLPEGTEHLNDSAVSAENTAVLHRKAHVTCTAVTISNPVPTVGQRSINLKIVLSAHSANLYFRMDFRANRDYDILLTVYLNIFILISTNLMH
jgi:hypothetical protein